MSLGRPRKTEGRVSLHTYLPTATAVKMQLYLTSEAHGGKIPQGAPQAFLTRLINEFFEHRTGVVERVDRTHLEKIHDLLGTIRDLAAHPRVSKEAFKAIEQFAEQALTLLLNEDPK